MKLLPGALMMTVLFAAAAAHAEVVLNPLQVEAERGPNLVVNGGFEELVDGLPAGWGNQEAGDWAVDRDVVHSGDVSLRFAKTDVGTLYWISQSVTLDQTSPRPLVVGAWSRAEGVGGNRGAEYSVWVDLQYTDGTPLWGQRAAFEVGTHDWQYAEHAFVVDKPVRTATVNLLFRRGMIGTAWFDDVSLQELLVGDGLVFDRTSAIEPETVAAAGEAEATLRTGDGLELAFDAKGRPASLTLQGEAMLGDGPGGLWIRDVATDGPWLRPDMQVSEDADGVSMRGQEVDAGLSLEARFEANETGIDAHVNLTDLTGTDRAVTVYFVLPLAEREWVWHNDVLSSLSPGDTGEYLNSSGWPISGLSSAYPFSALSSPDAGLSLSVPMDCPRIFRLTWNAGLGALYVAVNLGLTPETIGFPSQADFRFSIYHHDPEWGFRAAAQKYYERRPDFFVQRLQRGGIWMAFADISAIEDWQDFGFAYDENSATPLAFDNANDIASFRYIEPMTYWLPMAQTYPRTYEGAMQALDDNLTGGNEAQQRLARATLRCGTFTRDGRYDLSLRNQSWCDGAVFTLNPDPDIPEDDECPVNKGHLGYTSEWADANLLQATGPCLDGIYLDSLPNWGQVLNWRREHWRTVTVPLTFDPETKQPVLVQMFSTWQFARSVADDVHARGGVMHGNGGAMWPFFPSLLDTTGQETGAILSESTMAMARTLLRNKPYSPLLNTRFENLPPDYIEDYFHASLLWDIFPSFFNGSYLEEGKWITAHFFKQPELYNQARPLYRQFIPILRRMFDAGWEPVTLARATPANVRVERYGPGNTGEVLLAAFNPTGEPVQAVLTAEVEALGLGAGGTVTGLVSGAELVSTTNGGKLQVTVPLAAGRCEVVRIGP